MDAENRKGPSRDGEIFDLIIIGGGITAFGAAVYAGRFELKTLVVGESFGGAIILTDSVENYPGYISISGSDLFSNVRQHAKAYGVMEIEEKVVEVRSGDNGFVVQLRGISYFSKTILFATGSEWRSLGVPGEKELKGNGVHYCAICDGYLYKGKTVAVVGGSDSAAKEAMLLSEYADRVYIIYRKEKVRAEPINLSRLEKNPKIKIINNTNVVGIKGSKRVEAVVLDSKQNGASELKLDGVFIDIGHVPITYLTKKLGIALNEKDEIVVNKDGSTNIKGAYAAGDVTDIAFKQAITGVSQGVLAVYAIYHYIQNLAS